MGSSWIARRIWGHRAERRGRGTVQARGPERGWSSRTHSLKYVLLDEEAQEQWSNRIRRNRNNFRGLIEWGQAWWTRPRICFPSGNESSGGSEDRNFRTPAAVGQTTRIPRGSSGLFVSPLQSSSERKIVSSGFPFQFPSVTIDFTRGLSKTPGYQKGCFQKIRVQEAVFSRKAT